MGPVGVADGELRGEWGCSHLPTSSHPVCGPGARNPPRGRRPERGPGTLHISGLQGAAVGAAEEPWAGLWARRPQELALSSGSPPSTRREPPSHRPQTPSADTLPPARSTHSNPGPDRGRGQDMGVGAAATPTPSEAGNQSLLWTCRALSPSAVQPQATRSSSLSLLASCSAASSRPGAHSAAVTPALPLLPPAPPRGL